MDVVRAFVNIITLFIIALLIVLIIDGVATGLSDSGGSFLSNLPSFPAQNNPIITQIIVGLSIPFVVSVSYILIDNYIERNRRSDDLEYLTNFHESDRLYRMYWEHGGHSHSAIGLAIHDLYHRRLEMQQNQHQGKELVTQKSDRIEPVYKKSPIDLKPSLGLFKEGHKKFSKELTIEEQKEEVEELDYVEKAPIFSKDVVLVFLNLGKFGRYKVRIIGDNVKAERIEKNGKLSHRNPYISNSSHDLCLGSGSAMFLRARHQGKMYECIRIIAEVLQSQKGGGYRTWSDCRYPRNFLTR